MAFTVEVFPLRTSLLSFHLGHLHYLSFCPHLLGSRYVLFHLLILAQLQFTSDFSCYNIIVSLMQLLLHPESDDSAQLSQVRQNMKSVNCQCVQIVVWLVSTCFSVQIETEKLLAQLVETEINRRLVCFFGLSYNFQFIKRHQACLFVELAKGVFSVRQLIMFLATFAEGRHLQRKEVQCNLSLFWLPSQGCTAFKIRL